MKFFILVNLIFFSGFCTIIVKYLATTVLALSNNLAKRSSKFKITYTACRK